VYDDVIIVSTLHCNDQCNAHSLVGEFLPARKPARHLQPCLGCARVAGGDRRCALDRGACGGAEHRPEA
jgi:hypothetical protein